MYHKVEIRARIGLEIFLDYARARARVWDIKSKLN